jgi:hypothetical protein
MAEAQKNIHMSWQNSSVTNFFSCTSHYFSMPTPQMPIWNPSYQDHARGWQCAEKLCEVKNPHHALGAGEHVLLPYFV